MKHTIAIIEFPGTNCEKETSRAVARAHMNPLFVRWNQSRSILHDCDGFILSGGFSYEDRSRSGIIAAMDPIMETLAAEVQQGKPVIGICNGAQILVESGIVPGYHQNPLSISLSQNKQIINNTVVGTEFYNDWVYLTHTQHQGGKGITHYIEKDTIIRIPSAHAEGRFVIPNEVLEDLYTHDAIAFCYCDASGSIDPTFPTNPNGSIANIAALTNFSGNALAIMPHPERSHEGDVLFQALNRFCSDYKDSHFQSNTITITSPIETETQIPDEPFIAKEGSHELIIESIITDNTAISVEQALRKRGIALSVSRYIHWELIPSDDFSAELFKEHMVTAYESGMLFNENKEYPHSLQESKSMPHTYTFLVRTPQEDDCIGMHIHHAVTQWYGLSSIGEIRHGILWKFTSDTQDPLESAHVIAQALQTHICNNPLSHRRYRYDRL